MATIRDLAALIARRVLARNPIMPAVIVADLGLVNGTATVLVQTGDAVRRAVYAPPLAVRVGYSVFVMRAAPDTVAPLICVATNYQVGPQALGDTTWGDGPPGSAWGSGTGTWGEGAGQGTMPTTTTHYGWTIPSVGDGQAAAEALLSAVFAEIDQTLYELSLGGGGGGAALTVAEADGSPSVDGVTVIRLPNGTLVDHGGGVVEYLPAAGSAGHTILVNGAAFPQRARLEFRGSGLFGSDDAGAGTTIVTLVGADDLTLLTLGGDLLTLGGGGIELGGA